MPGPFLTNPYITAVNQRRCRQCGCTDNDCRQCIARTGVACYWVEADLCSACAFQHEEPVIEPEETHPND